MNHYKEILLISSEFPPGPGGIGNHAYNLANNLNLNNIKIKVLTTSDYVNENSADKFDRKLNFEILRFIRYDSKIKTYQKRIKIILHTLKNGSFTHIIFSGSFSLLISLLLRKYNRKIKFIAIAHGAEINPTNRAEKVLVNKALLKMDLIVSVSNYSKSKLPLNLNQNKIVVIPNGFDLDNINEIKISEKILQNGSLNLVSVGTVWPRKGHHNVLNALPEIISNYPETVYNIIGRLVDLSRVKNFFEDEKYKNHLKVYGAVSNEEMYKVLNDSQIFILLSESQSSGDFEGFGIAVLEANYFGLPAIGSVRSGLEDSISNGVTGILVDPYNTKEIIEAVKAIAKNYPMFSKRAREWAIQHHWSKIVQRYIVAIDNIT